MKKSFLWAVLFALLSLSFVGAEGTNSVFNENEKISGISAKWKCSCPCPCKKKPPRVDDGSEMPSMPGPKTCRDWHYDQCGKCGGCRRCDEKHPESFFRKCMGPRLV